jgi:hypothetical protein
LHSPSSFFLQFYSLSFRFNYCSDTWQIDVKKPKKQVNFPVTLHTLSLGELIVVCPLLFPKRGLSLFIFLFVFQEFNLSLPNRNPADDRLSPDPLKLK